LPRGAGEETLSSEARHGTNDTRKGGCRRHALPRRKPHRYFFKVYALDTQLDLKAKATNQGLLAAMKGPFLADGTLLGKHWC
jgi:phosphatidylethanolamine-binding protein (PEBP) family uncharacterized protein